MSKEIWNITELGKRKSEENTGNTAPRFMVLGYLEKSRDATVPEISDATQMSLSDVKGKLIQLKGEGWAARDNDGDDEFWM